MRFAIGEAQRAAPRAAENVPFVDAEFFAQRFDIADQVPGRVFAKLGVRGRFARAALVEKNDVICRRVEKLPVHRDQSAARPAVQKYDRNPVQDFRRVRNRSS